MYVFLQSLYIINGASLYSHILFRNIHAACIRITVYQNINSMFFNNMYEMEMGMHLFTNMYIVLYGVGGMNRNSSLELMHYPFLQ